MHAVRTGAATSPSSPATGGFPFEPGRSYAWHGAINSGFKSVDERPQYTGGCTQFRGGAPPQGASDGLLDRAGCGPEKNPAAPRELNPLPPAIPAIDAARQKAASFEALQHTGQGAGVDLQGRGEMSGRHLWDAADDAQDKTLGPGQTIASGHPL